MTSTEADLAREIAQEAFRRGESYRQHATLRWQVWLLAALHSILVIGVAASLGRLMPGKPPSLIFQTGPMFLAIPAAAGWGERYRAGIETALWAGFWAALACYLWPSSRNAEAWILMHWIYWAGMVAITIGTVGLCRPGFQSLGAAFLRRP
jgi:hypothetical protein